MTFSLSPHKFLMIFLVCLTSSQNGAAQIPSLDLKEMMRPIPTTSAFRDPGYYVWGGTMTRGDDGMYHLYYSRWKQSTGVQGWVTSSEVAHAVGYSMTGPFAFHDVALSPRGKGLWDGMVTHNPTIHRFGGKYYLYYMGDTGDGVIMKPINFVHRNNQRIGVAVADNPNGPWKRFGHPVIDISRDPSAADALCVANPSVTVGRDGRFYLLYKAVGRKKPLPFGGPVVHLMAVSDSPLGPFTKTMTPLFTIGNNNFPFEDPFLWFDKGRDKYFVIMKDNHGIVSGTGRSALVLYESSDTKDWKPSVHFLVSDLQLHWENRSVQRVNRMERPQLYFAADGQPEALIVAIAENTEGAYNVRIPLATYSTAKQSDSKEPQ